MPEPADGTLFEQFDVTPGKGFDVKAPTTKDGRSFITYGFENEQGEITYIGRASGDGSPEAVLKTRLAAGHDHFYPGLSPILVSVQSNKAANRGAEEFFMQGYRELGHPLTNVDEPISYRNPKAISYLDAFFDDIELQRKQ